MSIPIHGAIEDRTISTTGGVSASSTPMIKSFAPPLRKTRFIMPAKRAKKPVNIIGSQRLEEFATVDTASTASPAAERGEKRGCSVEHPVRQIAVRAIPTITLYLFQNNICINRLHWVQVLLSHQRLPLLFATPISYPLFV